MNCVVGAWPLPLLVPSVQPSPHSHSATRPFRSQSGGEKNGRLVHLFLENLSTSALTDLIQSLFKIVFNPLWTASAKLRNTPLTNKTAFHLAGSPFRENVGRAGHLPLQPLLRQSVWPSQAGLLATDGEISHMGSHRLQTNCPHACHHSLPQRRQRCRLSLFAIRGRGRGDAAGGEGGSLRRLQ